MGILGLAAGETFRGTKRLFISSGLLAMVFIITVMYFSTYERQYSRYEPFRKLLDSPGHTTAISAVRVNDVGGYEALANSLNKVKDYVNVYSMQVNGQLEDGRSIRIYGIDDRTASYRPAMSEGKWLSENPEEKGKLKAVVCANDLGIRAGDVFSFWISDADISLEICGVLEKNASCFAPISVGVKNNLFDFYHTYDPEREDLEMTMYMSLDDMRNAGIGYYGSFYMVSYGDDISEGEYEENRRRLENYGAHIILDNSTIKERTIEQIRLKLSTMTPVAAAGAILLSFGLIGLIGIDVRSKMGQYAVYYCCGMRWGQCIQLNIIQSVLSAVLASFIMILTGNVIELAGMKNLISFDYGKTQIIACLIVFFLEMVLSTAVPVIMIRREQPRDVIRKAKL